MTVGTVARPDVVAPSQPVKPIRLERLSTTRIVGALLVVVSHAGITYGLIGPGTARAPYRLIGLGLAPVVSYFFVLTGFVITWSYADRLKPREFYRGRVARLVPTNIVWWAIGIAVIVWYGFDVTHLGAFMTFFLLQGWVFDSKVVLTANPAAWSLSVDVLFYALFPLLLPLVRAIPRPHRFVLVALLALAQVELAVYTDLQHHKGYLYAVAYFPLSRLPEFLIGMVVALEIKHGTFPRVNLRLATLGGIGSLVVARLLVVEHQAYEWSAVAAVPAVLLIAALAQSDVRGDRSWLNRPALVKAGNWTFALYMLQIPIMRISFKLAGLPKPVEQRYLLAFGTSALCVVLAWAQYTYFERPLDQRIRGARKTRRPLA